MDPTLTVTGNLTRDPEFGFAATGNAWCRFTIAATPRVRDRETGEYRDGNTLWMRCVAWRQLAENVAESLIKGTRVVATGRLRQNDWQTPEGEKRTAVELIVEEIGPSLRWATATVNRMTRSAASATPPADPFAVVASHSVDPSDDQPPF